MENIYSCLDNKTFEIMDNKNLMIVDSKLAKTISILNKKGYYIDKFNVAKKSQSYIIFDLINNLTKEKVLDTENNPKKIKKSIKYVDCESTMIIFKENYKFNKLPDGYKLYDNKIFYLLSILKDTEELSFKSLEELDDEFNKSIIDLQNWAEKLPSII